MRLPVLRPAVVVGAAVAVAAGLVAYLPTAASAAVPAPSAPLYLHSANGGYAFDYALDPTVGTAPSGATLSTDAPTGDAVATATTYGVGLRGSATLPLFSIPVTGTVSQACVDIWAAPDGSGNLLSTTTLSVALVRPGLAAVDLDPVEAPYDGSITRVSGVVAVPPGTELPAGSSLQVAGAYVDDPTDLYYDSADMPSSVTFNPTSCAGKPVSGGGGSPSPTPSPTPTGDPTPDPSAASFRNYTPPGGFGNAAAEPSIGFSAKTGNVFMQGGYDTMRVSFDEASGDATWKLSVDQLTSQLISLDPMGYVDRQTGRVFASQLIGACSLTEFNDADGDGPWEQSEGCGLPHGADHQTIGGGPFGPGVVATSYPNAVWYCSQSIATALCALSRDGGQTFGEGTPLYTIAECGGLHGHVRVGPDGTAYVPNSDCGARQVGVSLQTDGNNVAPWETILVPDSSTQAESDPSVAVDPAGTMFVGYAAGNGHPKIATYDTAAKTWTPSVDVGTAFGIQNVQFPDVITGDAGRAAFSFLGTPTAGDDQAAGFNGTWHLYVAMTYDGGRTWTTTDATPTDPVQRGCIWLGGGDNACRNLLDFTDITTDAKGRVLVGYADGCTNACVTDPAQNNRANLATIARQSGGKTLFAAYDPPAIVGTTTTYTGTTTARTGSALPVSATLVGRDGNVPAGAQVRFSLGGTDITVPVDASGRAAGELPAAAGELTAAFLGSTGYGPSTNKVTVSTYDVRLAPSVPATPVSGAATPVTVTAVRTDTGATDATWTGTPSLTSTDTHLTGVTCAPAVDGIATCSGVAFGDLGAQTLTATAAGGFVSGSAPVTVQPTGIAFVSPPASAKSGTATTYTTRPLAAAGGLLDGYRAVQALSTNGKADTVPAPQSCSGATCTLTVTFGKGGGTRTVTVKDTSTPSRSATTTTAVRG